ncbi:DUF397 domain-containing protein [Streptomyces sp. NPDC020379]
MTFTPTAWADFLTGVKAIA